MTIDTKNNSINRDVDLNSPLWWTELEDSEKDREEIAGQSLSYWKDVWRRFRGNRLAMLGLSIIVVLVFAAVFVPFFSHYNYYEQELTFSNIPPIMKLTRIGPDKYVFMNKNLMVYEISAKGELIKIISKKRNNIFKKQVLYEIDKKEYIIDYNELPVRFFNPEMKILKPVKWVLNRTYIFGTDALGRDLFIRQIYGARISLLVAFIATAVNFLIGVLYGGISGYIGGNTDNVMMRIVEIISTIPLMLYVILMLVVLNSGFVSIILALGTVYWVDMARIVRGQILALKEQEYVSAAIIMGAGTRRILFRHLIPNTMGPIIVTMTMLIPQAIFIEAFMSFIGLGVAPPMASWGTLCSDSLESLRSYPYQLFFPACAISITMFAFNFLGDGLRDALDPRLRK